MMDFTDFLDGESDLDRDAALPICPVCRLTLPVTGVCC